MAVMASRFPGGRQAGVNCRACTTSLWSSRSKISGTRLKRPLSRRVAQVHSRSVHRRSGLSSLSCVPESLTPLRRTLHCRGNQRCLPFRQLTRSEVDTKRTTHAADVRQFRG